jgi:prepilin-type N-terminal cleavage/methylation domain-containing protein
MKKLHKGQRGFTLIEMLVVLTLIGLITGGITAAIMQILTINHSASNHMIAVRQVQQAGKEVSKDTLQSQSVNATGGQGFPLTLIWEEYGTNQTHLVIYDFGGMSGEGKELERSHTINGGNLTVIRVAQYIDPYHTSCSWNNATLTFTVTATVGSGPYEAIEKRIYEIEPRPGS